VNVNMFLEYQIFSLFGTGVEIWGFEGEK